MQLIIDKTRVTAMTRSLEARLAKRCGITVKHADAIEILAGMLGYDTSNALLAAARGTAPTLDTTAPNDSRKLYEITWTYFDYILSGGYRATARLSPAEAERLQALLDAMCARYGRICDPKIVVVTEDAPPSNGPDGAIQELAARFGDAALDAIDAKGILAGTATTDKNENDAGAEPSEAGTILIPAKITADEGGESIEFDAAPWFQSATPEKHAELLMRDCERCQVADEVVYAVRERVETIDDLLADLEARTARGEDAGFECTVDQKAALAWIHTNGAYGKVRTALSQRPGKLQATLFSPSSALAHFLAIESNNVAKTLDDALDSLLQMDEQTLHTLSIRMRSIQPARDEIEIELLQLIGDLGGGFRFEPFLDSTDWNMD